MSDQTEGQHYRIMDASDATDVPPRKMKHVEVQEKEILFANSGGEVCAPCDRCGHMNAPLSMGTLNGEVVT